MKRWLAILFIANLSGCAALTNPVPDGIPASCVPDDWLAKPKERAELLPVTLLGQNKPAVYRLAPGDSLGVWIESVLSSFDAAERADMVEADGQIHVTCEYCSKRYSVTPQALATAPSD